MPRVGLPSGSETLQSIADVTGGRQRIDVREALSDPLPVARKLGLLTPMLCLCAMVLFLIEIAGRRWSWWERLSALRVREKQIDVGEPGKQLEGATIRSSQRNWLPWKRFPRSGVRKSRGISDDGARKSVEDGSRTGDVAGPDVSRPAPTEPRPDDAFARAKQRAKKRM
jgi:hypothetical protein